jgi:hypothetical protein
VLQKATFMIARCRVLSAPAMVLALVAGSASQAPAQVYKRTGSNEIIQGYVPDGEWVETTGHAWQSPHGVFLNFNLPSAMVPLRIDIANVAPDSVARLKAECSAPRQFDGGCDAVVRGQVTTIGGRKGIVAREIQIRPR